MDAGRDGCAAELDVEGVLNFSENEFRVNLVRASVVESTMHRASAGCVLNKFPYSLRATAQAAPPISCSSR